MSKHRWGDERRVKAYAALRASTTLIRLRTERGGELTWGAWVGLELPRDVPERAVLVVLHGQVLEELERAAPKRLNATHDASAHHAQG